MFDVMKSAALLQKVVTPDHHSWLTAAEVLWAATRGGARSARLTDEVGAIEPGRKADLVLLDMRTVNFTPLNDVRNHLVYCENGASILQVMVNGRVVVENGRCQLVDEDAVLAELRDLAPEMLARHAEAERLNEVFAPYFEEIHRRSCAQPLGINRYAGDEAGWLLPARP
jgi:5-methylthioadenosine/S-adenosylhomocysteine deaminase